jgi:hypothetical protein
MSIPIAAWLNGCEVRFINSLPVSAVLSFKSILDSQRRGHARRAKLRQAYAKFCEETSDYAGKGSVMDFVAGALNGSKGPFANM